MNCPSERFLWLSRNLSRFIRATSNMVGHQPRAIHLNARMTEVFRLEIKRLNYARRFPINWRRVESGKQELTWRGIPVRINADRFRLDVSDV